MLANEKISISRMGRLAAYHLVCHIPLLKSIDAKYVPARRHIGPNDGHVNLHEVLNDLYLRNGCKRRLTNDFPLFPSKTLSDDPQIKSVGVAVPEIQLGLCKGSGTGVGAKTVHGA